MSSVRFFLAEVIDDGEADADKAVAPRTGDVPVMNYASAAIADTVKRILVFGGT